MNCIVQLITEEKYTDLLKVCEELEIQSAADASIDYSKIYPVYLAACVLSDNLQTARHVRKRILQNPGLNTPETQAVWQIVTNLLKKAYPQVYQDFDNFQWTEYIQPLISKIKQNTREKMFQMISNVYSSIELAQASNYFGLPEDNTLQELVQRGWSYDEASKILYPVKIVSVSQVPTKYNQFERLADIVLNLDKY